MKKKLHVVFKTHLDIGFTDLAENVIEQYLFDFIPRALDLAEAIPEKFVWTTGSWLIDYYLNSPKISEINKKRLETAIQKGTICWHGLPFTTHTELMDEELLCYGLSLSNKLDKRYGKKTIAAKMTDVPGHSQGMIPSLNQAGIRYLHIGVNASSAVPDVPKLFRWQFEGKEVIVQYADDYGEVFLNEAWDTGIYFAHTHDNMGPPGSVDEVLEMFKQLEMNYPDYEIVASTLDAYAQSLQPYVNELPIINQEIGDSWIHGIASDPLKIADFKRLLQFRNKWVKEGKLLVDSKEYQEMSNYLLMVPEHTWGGNGNVFLPDYRNYLLADFHKARAEDNIQFNHNRKTMDFADLMAYISTDIEDTEMNKKRSFQRYEQSWKEQRDYVKEALSVLPRALQEEFNNRSRQSEEIHWSQESIAFGKVYQFENIEISFGTAGEITKLCISEKEYLSAEKSFGKLSYERYDHTDYAQFFKDYSRLTQQTSGWALGDFGKRGIEAYKQITHEQIVPYVVHSSIAKEKQKNRVYIQFELNYPKQAVEQYGLPEKNSLTYCLDTEKRTLELSYQWENKQANRMPESYWLETSIQVESPGLWRAMKLNHSIDFLTTVQAGNRAMHCCTEEGMVYSDFQRTIKIQSIDAPLFSIGGRKVLDFSNHQPEPNEGLYVNLYNNIWGTNFPAWFEDDMTYEVKLSF